jgi:hypothetical protein
MTLFAKASETDERAVEVHCTHGPIAISVTEDRGHVASFWSQLGRLLHSSPELREARARAGYERYARSAGGVSAVSGDTLPTWDEQAEEIREHWRNAFAE